jgi:hypothetical protein
MPALHVVALPTLQQSLSSMRTRYNHNENSYFPSNLPSNLSSNSTTGSYHTTFIQLPLLVSTLHAMVPMQTLWMPNYLRTRDNYKNSNFTTDATPYLPSNLSSNSTTGSYHTTFIQLPMLVSTLHAMVPMQTLWMPNYLRTSDNYRNSNLTTDTTSNLPSNSATGSYNSTIK